MSETGYAVVLLEADERTPVYKQEYATLPDVARALLAAYDLETNERLLDENGELTMQVYGADGRILTAEENESLFALVAEFGGKVPRSDEEAAFLRLTNPNRRT